MSFAALSACSAPAPKFDIFGNVPRFQLTSQDGMPSIAVRSLVRFGWRTSFTPPARAMPAYDLANARRAEGRRKIPQREFVSFSIDPKNRYAAGAGQLMPRSTGRPQALVFPDRPGADAADAGSQCIQVRQYRWLHAAQHAVCACGWKRADSRLLRNLGADCSPEGDRRRPCTRARRTRLT